ncbi:hypothetical protein CPC16_008624 [Podila verticillata]|nr:hypothetical protein BGZ52_007285 [Haplosporangium bisporale]KAF9211602.1 hypothetical protein BGZ59_007861 [Podila verticillata]KAF9384073.1 hypothetical protein CPC16_008624 [Podila verticillata]
MLSRTVTWTLSCALLLLASTAIADRIPGNQPESDHSNYGDMHKAKEFAKEHMGEKAKTMTEKEELMMLFSLHDANKDGYLDGIELRAAFSDFNQGAPETALSLQAMNDMIDHVIGEDDVDNE